VTSTWARFWEERDCVETWRAMTECITEVGFTCTDNKIFPQQDSCRELTQNHAECLQAN
jgi:hypothetical protein